MDQSADIAVRSGKKSGGKGRAASSWFRMFGLCGWSGRVLCGKLAGRRRLRIAEEMTVAFRSAKVALLSQSERRQYEDIPEALAW